MQLDPTQPCGECLSQDEIDKIYNHSLDDQCQVTGLDLGDFSDYGFVNVFIFNAPVYGDIYGVADGILCQDGDLEACVKIQGTTPSGSSNETDNEE